MMVVMLNHPTEKNMDSLTLYLLISSLIIPTFILILTSNLQHMRRSASKLPPGPYPLPILGNILELGQNPHQTLTKLSQTYGPLMLLRLGSIRTLIVSSSDVAKEVLKNEQSFHSRYIPSGAQALDHHKFSIAWLPSGTHWRKLRKISKEQMFTTQKLDGSQSLRQEKLRALCDYVKKCSVNGQTVDIGKAAVTTSLNLLSTTLVSVDFATLGSGSLEVQETVLRVMENAGKPNIADYFPVLKSLDPQGVKRRIGFYFAKLLQIFEGIINERLQSRRMSISSYVAKNDLLEVLLDLNQSDNSEFSSDDIKHLLLDLFVGGTDTSAAAVEWAMAELLRSPEKMSKAKTELTNFIGAKTELITIQESDISKLPYLQAVVKETLRLHPSLPFLLRKAETDTEIGNFLVPKNTQVLVNVWAIGHDSSIWSSPDSFMPERFIEHAKEFKGQDFEYLPFGTGRRICPGLSMANRTVPLMLASLIHNFEWELEKGMKPGELDMTEKFGLSVQKAVPLRAVPIKP